MKSIEGWAATRETVFMIKDGKIVWQSEAGDQVRLTPDGIAIVCNPDRPPRKVYPDGTVEEFKP
jgi:hypothetical protein